MKKLKTGLLILGVWLIAAVGFLALAGLHAPGAKQHRAPTRAE